MCKIKRETVRKRETGLIVLAAVAIHHRSRSPSSGRDGTREARNQGAAALPLGSATNNGAKALVQCGESTILSSIITSAVLRSCGLKVEFDVRHCCCCCCYSSGLTRSDAATQA